jgi:hypothetical protein
MIIILDLLEELTVKYLIGAIPEGFSSTQYILQGGVRWYTNCALGTRGRFTIQSAGWRTGKRSEKGCEI